MSIFKIKKAYSLYRKYIYVKDLQKLLRDYSRPIAGSVPSVVWELFGAILTDDKGKKGYGSDLDQHEVKSALDGASFEYQYHLNSGQEKLTEDMKVRHLFISYSSDYKNIDVRILVGEALMEKFKSWHDGLVQNYSGPNRKLRYRKSVSFGFVKKHGAIVMQIRNGKLVAASHIA